MKVTYPFSTRIKIAADIVVLFLIILFVHYWKNENEYFLKGDNLVTILSCLVLWFISARFMGLYQDYRETPFSIEWVSFLKSLLLYAMISAFAFILFLKDYGFNRTEMILQLILLLIFLPVQKIVFRIILKKLKTAGHLKRKVLIVGAGVNGMDFYQQVVKRENYGYTLTGFIDEESIQSLNGSYLGNISDIDKVLAKYETDDIVVTKTTDDTVLQRIVNIGEKEGKRVRIIPDYQRFGPRKLSIERLGTMPVISLRNLPLDNLDNKIIKRCFDIVFSLLIISLVFIWLFPIIALLIKLNSKGPVFFRQERWGLNNKPINCYKFRSMVASSRDIDESGKYQQASKNDPRITKIGAFLRKTNLDELPQFINVLLGSMSVVGPRPHPVPLNIQSKDSVENYMMRHLVKPGITGWAQVNGFRGETKDAYLMKKRVEHDVWYLENWTFWIDQQIIIQTLVNMVKGDKNAF
ncbi:undecaprenyl-phosphate glucose phosphotransferase [Flavihumibacter sp. CACIAM 22H1]|uniref:undecaprenyl-phosphate glucose phosphotransferase n=1 Tax=Flavihumibacter sp. CACIAM 22H1 TaxID=1812911 RepID=UPI0007A85E8D|nr:undecaprenyl-phosphate glucose phosphotransferase [Flavihumibacter sp. CACIAM 22H1]KYP15969.1 MAG: hypothetical protein A1D16_06825 [Flavihumibacter sp. CACIAM 22H1]